ncbi:hypothetical protein [Sporosarcina sp. FSL K6-2383]|uniref:hypothetical protein n=1 Tax=Sporosarcina sp. FSL K6-2383 TaxID=2921556 RepID=UPI00315A6BF8
MKISLRDVTNRRRKEKCYLIEHEDGDYFVIYGSKYREVIGGDLWDSISSFIKGDVGWNFVDKRLRFNRDDEYREGHKHNWQDFNEEVKAKVLDVDSLYIDGEKQVIDSVKSNE